MFKRTSNYWVALFIFCLSSFSLLQAITKGSEEQEQLEERLRKIQQASQRLEGMMKRVPLIEAVEARDISSLQNLLSWEEDVNQQDQDGNTALHIAAKNNDRDSAEWLLAYNADPNIKGQLGYTPLHWAVGNDNEVLVEVLIGQGANPDIQSDDGMTPRALASEKIRKVLEKAAAPAVALALHKAAREGLLKDAKDLINEGADVNAQDKQGFTPLHWAALNNEGVIADLLLEHKAKINVTDKNNMTPLHHAVQKGHDDMVFQLIDARANLNVQGSNKYTPLHLAAIKNNEQVVKGLLREGADYTILDAKNMTAVEQARDTGASEAEKALSLPLITAAFRQDISQVEKLLESGVDANVQDQNGDTALLMAVDNKNKELVKLLIDNGANPNLVNKDGETPFSLAREFMGKEPEYKEIAMILEQAVSMPKAKTPVSLSDGLHTLAERLNDLSTVLSA